MPVIIEDWVHCGGAAKQVEEHQGSNRAQELARQRVKLRKKIARLTHALMRVEKQLSELEGGL